jgi:hypothetical protein
MAIGNVCTKFSMVRDINGMNGFGLEFTNTAYSATLAAATATALTIPGTASLGGCNTQTKRLFLAIFVYTPGSSVWVANNATAAVPAGAAFASTASELNPAARLVQAGDILSFITTPANTDVNVLLYSLT